MFIATINWAHYVFIAIFVPKFSGLWLNLINLPEDWGKLVKLFKK